MFYLGQLIINKKNQRKALFMGIDQDKGRAHLLIKENKKIQFPSTEDTKHKNDFFIKELIVPIIYLDLYKHATNKDGKIDPGTFSIKTFLYGKFHGCLKWEEADSKSKENIKKLAFETL